MSETQDQVIHQNDGYRQTYEPMSTIEVIQAMDSLRAKKDALEDQLKAVNLEYDFLRHILVPELFERDGIDNMKVTDVGRVSLTSDIRVSIPAHAKDQAFEFFDLLGKGDIVTRTVNASTLKAVVKSMILNGEDVPDTIFTVTPFTRASITKR
jgi:hypothetical protein